VSSRLSRHLLLDCLSLWLRKLRENVLTQDQSGEAIMDSELGMSLDDEEEHVSTDGTESSIAQ
jgi:hypothetical protein